MSTKEKNGLPNTVGKTLSKQVPNPDPADCLDDYSRLYAAQFSKRHEHTLNLIVAAIDQAALLGCGDDLLLWDAAMLGLAQRVRNHLARSGVAVVGKEN